MKCSHPSWFTLQQLWASPFEESHVLEMTEGSPRLPGCVSRLWIDSFGESGGLEQAATASNGALRHAKPLTFNVRVRRRRLISYAGLKSGRWRVGEGSFISRWTNREIVDRPFWRLRSLNALNKQMVLIFKKIAAGMRVFLMLFWLRFFKVFLWSQRKAHLSALIFNCCRGHNCVVEFTWTKSAAKCNRSLDEPFPVILSWPALS